MGEENNMKEQIKELKYRLDNLILQKAKFKAGQVVGLNSTLSTMTSKAKQATVIESQLDDNDNVVYKLLTTSGCTLWYVKETDIEPWASQELVFKPEERVFKPEEVVFRPEEVVFRPHVEQAYASLTYGDENSRLTEIFHYTLQFIGIVLGLAGVLYFITKHLL